jgi:hypothetical protein
METSGYSITVDADSRRGAIRASGPANTTAVRRRIQPCRSAERPLIVCFTKNNQLTGFFRPGDQ